MTYEIEIHPDPGLGNWASYNCEPFRASLWSGGRCSIQFLDSGFSLILWAHPGQPHPIDRVITSYLAAAAAMGLETRTHDEWRALFDQMLSALRAANESAATANEGT